MRRTISWMTDGVAKEITVDREGDYLTIVMDNGDRMTMEYNRYYALGAVINELGDDPDELQVVSKVEFNKLGKVTQELLVPSLAKKELEVENDEPQS